MSNSAASKVVKVAYVTGGASGIGYAVAKAFVERGYATVVVDRNESLGKQAQTDLSEHGECTFVACDVLDDSAVKASVDKTLELYGRLDAAFNCAGLDGEQGPLAEGSMANWDRVIGVNLTGTFSCMRYQIPAMLKDGGGAIVNCSSVAGLVGAPNLSPYIAAKHGVIGLTKAAALDYAKQGISVNAVCPAMIDTPLSKESLSPDVRKMMMDQSPIGRFGSPDDIASMVLWLCDDNSKFLTGQAIAIDGGWTTR